MLNVEPLYGNHRAEFATEPQCIRSIGNGGGAADSQLEASFANSNRSTANIPSVRRITNIAIDDAMILPHNARSRPG